eukprot:Gb_36228 [translate_table: standard]
MDTSIGDVNSEWPASNDVGCPPCKKNTSAIQSTIHCNSIMNSSTLGRHVARRLVEIGVKDVFSVPGDFNLAFLDHLIAEPELNLVHQNECRNLPVICIVGGPNSNDYGSNRILHHTIGLPDFSQEYRCFRTVTCAQVIVNNLEDAHELIDYAISTALKESKPVYISISCNMTGIRHPTFSLEPVPYCLSPRISDLKQFVVFYSLHQLSNPRGLEAAVETAAEFLNAAVKPVLVGGPKAGSAFVELANASDAKVGLFACYAGRMYSFKEVGALKSFSNHALGQVYVVVFFIFECKAAFVSGRMTAQDVSTLIRCEQRSIIFLINNGGYTIQVELHDGPYNVIKNWKYTGLVDAIHNGEGKCWTAKVRTEEEVVEAIKTAQRPKKDCLCFIEVIVHKDDTSKELLQWGSRVSAADTRPPIPQ